ncbi:MAG: hypothetical protein CUN53_06025 [Phototrophicales bacterium]|nr:MAG: hypothetical protein CUN53_06025 [Phototrophicales bacterium]
MVGAQPGSPRGNPGGDPDDGGRGRSGMLHERGWMRGVAAREVISAVVEATGLNRAEVRRALRSGDTLADVIAANGSDVSAVTAEVIAVLTARVETALANGRITQAQADTMIANIEAQVPAVINGEVGLGSAARVPSLRSLRVNREALIDAVMEATGLTRGQILGQLIDGATLGSIIMENGGSVDAVITAALANARELLDQAVINGQLTQQRADQMLQQLTEMLQDAMNGMFRLRRGLL